MVQIGKLEIGTGMPKICVPIVGTSKEQILTLTGELPLESVDFIEWRADYFEHVNDHQEVIWVAQEMKDALGNVPLLFTFRTTKEGGEREISLEEYQALLSDIAASGAVDIIDVEMFRGYDARRYPKKEWRVTDACNQEMREFIKKLKAKVKVIGSYHDFDMTPSREEILRRLLFMDRMGADIPKMAVMPKEREDVLRLMEATSLADRLMVEKPLITMSMGALGAVTRVSGESFGSSVTFGCMGESSAPGQIPVRELRRMLEILHKEGD